MAADPHNVVRLILPRPTDGTPGAEYREAALSLRQWLAEGILVPDPEPALYLYEQAAVAEDQDLDRENGGPVADPASLRTVQRGLIGAVRLQPPEAGIVLPHENVSPGPVQGRLELMEATQANLEPIFLLYDGDEASAARRIIDRVAATGPLLEALPGDGMRHRLWAITDPADLAAIAADLAPRQALIADGHHRYAAYRALRERRREAGHGAGPWDYGLALLVDSAAYPPEIGAIHRVIPGLDVADAAKLAGTAFTVTELAGGSADVAAAEAALERASATGPAFVVAGGERAYLLTDPDPEQAAASMPEDASPQWQALPYSVMQRLLIMRLWGLADDDATVRVVHHDAGATLAAAGRRRGSRSCAVRCRRPTSTPSPPGARRCRGSRPRSPRSRGPAWCSGCSPKAESGRGGCPVTPPGPGRVRVWPGASPGPAGGLARQTETMGAMSDAATTRTGSGAIDAVTPLGNEVFQIDTRMAGDSGITAGYLIRSDRPCLVETGTAPSAPLVASSLAALGVGPDDLATIVVTHIHLDHAGGTGDLAAMFPRAEIVVHELGARHLADPSRLMASARMVYGDELDRLFGALAPTPAERIRAVETAGVVDLGGGRRLDSHYSPGHARHHVGLIDSVSGDLYVGDAAGMYVPETGEQRPATPPPDFDLAVALESLRLFADLRPTRLLFSHFGPAENVDEALARSAEEISVWVAETRNARDAAWTLITRWRWSPSGPGTAIRDSPPIPGLRRNSTAWPARRRTSAASCTGSTRPAESAAGAGASSPA